MAIAERRLAAEFNRAGHAIVDHRTFVICSDGDLQEGIAAEAASLAGHLRLGKLTMLYDDNHIQLDGPTSMAFSEDVPARFDAYGWHTRRVPDGNDLEAISAAIQEAIDDDRPSLIAVRTHIGYGSPNKQDSQKAHGSPLGPDEVRLTKEAYGWDPDKTFYVPDEAAALFSRAIPRGEQLAEDWQTRLRPVYRAAFPADAAELMRRLDGDLRPHASAGLKTYAVGEDFATRQASQAAIQDLAETVPELFGGAADLSESNLTDIKGAGDFRGRRPRPQPPLRRPRARHGRDLRTGSPTTAGSSPTAATFLNFSDYMRGSVRLAALAGLHVIYVWTHDSVGLGEDGPTHQPVEHYAALRAIPNLWFIRPGDANETSAAWALAVSRQNGPVALSLTRQKLTTLPETAERARDGVARGGYVVRESSGGPESIDLLLIATGSELPLAAAAADLLTAEGVRTRVVSMPCWELFELQPAAYRNEVLPPAVRKRVTVGGGRVARLGTLRRRRGRDRRHRSLRRERPGRRRSSSTSASPRSGSPMSAGASSGTACAAASRPSITATSRPVSAWPAPSSATAATPSRRAEVQRP